MRRCTVQDFGEAFPQRIRAFTNYPEALHYIFKMYASMPQKFPAPLNIEYEHLFGAMKERIAQQQSHYATAQRSGG